MLSANEEAAGGRMELNQPTTAAGFGETTFDRFQQGLGTLPSNWRSTEQHLLPPAPSPTFGAVQRTEGLLLPRGSGRGCRAAENAEKLRRPGDKNGDQPSNSDMSLDESMPLARGAAAVASENHSSETPNTHLGSGSGDNTRSLETIILRIIEENRRRDAERDAMMDRLLTRLSLTSNSQPLNNVSTLSVSPQNYQVMPDLSKNISFFTGNESSSESREWIANLNSMCVLHRWPDAFALESARMHLSNGAKDWFVARRQELSTWSLFQQAFHNTYVRQDSTTSRWKKMAERTQLRDKPLQQYFHNKVKLCKDLQLPTEDIKEQLLVGLWSRDLFNAMSARYHTSLDNLLHDMLEYEHMTKQRVDRTRTISNVTSPLRRLSEGSNIQARVPRVTISESSGTNGAQPNTNIKGEPKCFNCQAFGHLSRDCNLPRKEPYCVRCKQHGHYQRACTQNISEVKVISTQAASSIQKYLKTALVNGIKLKAFVDMGSAACIITASAALHNHYPIIYETSDLKSFGPESYRVISPGYVVATIQVDEAVAEEIQLRIVSDEVLSTDLLLGRTFTDHDQVDYSKNGEMLVFKQRSTQTTHTIQEPDSENIQVTANMTVPPFSVNMIETRTSHAKLVLPVLNLNKESQIINETTVIDRGIISRLPVLSIESPRSAITPEDLDIGSNQPQTIVEDLLGIINSFRDCVAVSISEIGCARGIEMKIDETPGAKPINCKPYRASDIERGKMREILAEWRAAGIIRDTTSPYASPVLLVRKKNGDSRLVVDFRRLNRQTQRIHFPLPDPDEHLSIIADSKLFIALDLFNGYLQIPLAEGSKHKTAIITPDETAEFNRLIFGLMNGPAIFSKYMSKVLQPLRKSLVLFFLDDILIAGKTWEDLRPKLVAVFEALRAAGLTINIKKCQFLKHNVTYLGFELSGEGIQPGSQKVSAIKHFPVPQNVHEVRRFLGLSGFFRRFVPKFAEIAHPLHTLLKVNQPFIWNRETNAAFERLRDILIERPILQPFISTRYTELHTDASTRGLVAMLLQRDDENKMHLMYTISRRTNEAEQFYHSSKLELLAIIWAVSRLRQLLINISFKIVTDCQALVYLNTYRTKNAQIVRWHHLLSEFDYEISHREGVKLAHVDALSRAPTDGPEENSCKLEEIQDVWSINCLIRTNKDCVNECMSDSPSEVCCVFTIISDEDEILAFQFRDDDLARKRAILNKPNNQRTRIEKDLVTDYELTNGILYKRLNNKLCYVVPRSMRKSLTVRFHDYNGHQGVERTLELMSRRYYFCGMRRYIKQHVYACFHCLAAKTRPGRQAGELHPIPPGKRPFHTVHVDHVGPFVKSGRGNKFVFVLIDNLTKYVLLTAMRDTKASNVIKALENFVYDFGAPERIISDRGTCFTSKTFEEFCVKHGVKHVLTSPRHPQANGQVERVNATLVPLMQATLTKSNGRDWDVKLRQIQRDLNEARNATTGKSPFEILYGYIPTHDEGSLRRFTNISDEYRADHTERHAEATEIIAKEQEKMKLRYDVHRALNVKFKVGDLVFLKVNPIHTGESTKLQYKNRGVFAIMASLPGDTYRITQLSNNKNARRYSTTAHASQLKLWAPPLDEFDENSDNEDEKSQSLKETAIAPNKLELSDVK